MKWFTRGARDLFQRIRNTDKGQLPETSGFSREVYEAMADRIRLNSQRYRDYIKGLRGYKDGKK